MQHSKAPSKEIQNVVAISMLSSIEHIVQEGEVPRRILCDVHLRIDRAQTWGITARTGYEIRLLLEIMSNIRPYDVGKCVLVERGMMRRKRVVQPHVFYIGNTDMLYDNMNVLEYLMFVTAKIREDRLSMQKELFEFLIDLGLGNISLTIINLLTSEEKAVVALIAAAYSRSVMIVFNIPATVFDERLQDAIAKISELTTKRNKALIIGTKDCTLIQKACSHTTFIADGRIIFQGTTDLLRQEYDKVAVIIYDSDIDVIKQKLASILNDCVLIENEGHLLVKASCEAHNIYRAILEAGFVPRCIRINEKTVSRAYEELIERNDLSEQLF